MSKELEALEIIKNAPTIYVGCGSNIYTMFPFECKMIETALKALEIIKKKGINALAFITSNNADEYNYMIMYNTGMCYLYEKEYILLKEVFHYYNH